MTKSIKINMDTTSSIASGITGTSSDIRLSPLTSQDGRSTITANKSSKTAYNIDNYYKNKYNSKPV